MNGLIPYEYYDKKISPWGGMRIIKEFYDWIGLYDKIRELPLHSTGSAIGVEHHEILESFMMSVILGAGNSTGAAQIRYDFGATTGFTSGAFYYPGKDAILIIHVNSNIDNPSTGNSPAEEVGKAFMELLTPSAGLSKFAIR